MPIEVRELVIKARVEDTQAETRQSRRAGEAECSLSDNEMEAIITQCVDRVVEVLRRQRER
jgi:hypothetical protein